MIEHIINAIYCWIMQKIYKYSECNKNLNIKLVDKNAKVPKRGSDDAAGYDLYSINDEIIMPNERKLIDTGIQLEIPKHYYGRIASRSGLAFKNGIDVCAGVIDSDYRNNIFVLLHNSGNKEFNINFGDRIGQIIFEKYHTFNFRLNDIRTTKRGMNGFGSTGVN